MGTEPGGVRRARRPWLGILFGVLGGCCAALLVVAIVLGETLSIVVNTSNVLVFTFLAVLAVQRYRSGERRF